MFTPEEWPITVHFTGDESGRITSLRMTNRRVRNLCFERVGDVSPNPLGRREY